MFETELSSEEIRYAKLYLQNLTSSDWAKMLLKSPLVKTLENSKNATDEHRMQLKSWILELAVANALLDKNFQVIYEYKAGIKNTSVDFKIYNQEVEFLVELVSNRDLEKLKVKNQVEYPVFSAHRDGVDQALDMIKIQDTLLSKICHEQNRIKFPIPSGNLFNVIIINVESFNLGIMDEDDRKVICYGNSSVPDVCRRYFKDVGVAGIFDSSHPNQAMSYLRSGVHLVGFFNPKESEKIFFCPNPMLFKDDEEVQKVFGAFPIKKLFKRD